MLNRASRIVALIALLFSAAFASAPVVAAHAADDGGVCNGSIKIVVFENYDETGSNDDFCFYPYYSVAQDPNFDSNDAASTYVPDDDIGNRYLMGCCVSSISVVNNWTAPICIWMYSGTNFTGYSTTYYYTAGSHYHGNFYNLSVNDLIRSMKVRMNPASC